MPFNKKITPENKAKAEQYKSNANYKGSKQNVSKTDKKKYIEYKSGIDPLSGSFARIFFPDSPFAKQYAKYGTKAPAEVYKEKKINKIPKSNNVSTAKQVSDKYNQRQAEAALTGKPAATQTKPKSRPRTSSEIAAGVKSTPSKMQIAGLPKSGNTMLMGSKEVETPSTFNTSAASNIAKAPNFAKMAEDGASVKEMRSTLKDYRKTVKGQVKEHKAAIKKQNKTTKFKKKSSKIGNRANKAIR